MGLILSILFLKDVVMFAVMDKPPDFVLYICPSVTYLVMIAGMIATLLL